MKSSRNVLVLFLSFLIMKEGAFANGVTEVGILLGTDFFSASQVVCIRSTWNALSPKLSCDTRPLILKTLSELFSLVPSLTVNTAEYEVCVWSSINYFYTGKTCTLE